MQIIMQGSILVLSLSIAVFILNNYHLMPHCSIKTQINKISKSILILAEYCDCSVLTQAKNKGQHIAQYVGGGVKQLHKAEGKVVMEFPFKKQERPYSSGSTITECSLNSHLKCALSLMFSSRKKSIIKHHPFLLPKSQLTS